MADPQFNTEPIGKLGIIACKGCEEMAAKINYYLVQKRQTQRSL